MVKREIIFVLSHGFMKILKLSFHAIYLNNKHQ